MPKRPSITTLVELHSAEVFAYLCRLIQDIRDAEDCLQETFLHALRAYPHLKHDTNLRAWLFRIATNQAYTQLRKRNRLSREIADLDNRIHSANVEIEPSIERKELLSSISQAVSSLPHKQGAALVMRKYQHLSYAEIAEALNCSQESARSSVYQALKKLRAQYNEETIYE